MKTTALFLCAVLLSACTVTLPIAATSNALDDSPKRGESTATYVLGMCFAGDASIATAARNGGIHHIVAVDQRLFNFVGVFQKRTTIVTGQ